MYKFARMIFLFYFKVFNRLTIRGNENIIQDGATIVFANHFSDFDAFLLSTAFKRQIYFMAKSSLFKIPIIRFFVKKYGAISVDRKKNDIGAIKNAMKVLKEGKQLGIFPEGTRVKDESDSDAKGGVAMLAYKCKATLIPVRLKYKRKIHFCNHYEIIIDKPIKWNEIGVEDKNYKVIGEKLMEHIYEL